MEDVAGDIWVAAGELADALVGEGLAAGCVDEGDLVTAAEGPARLELVDPCALGGGDRASDWQLDHDFVAVIGKIGADRASRRPWCPA
jgi:hypothetical protein